MMINLTVGDCGGDGHGRTSAYLYDVGGIQSRKELIDYHEIGCREYLGGALDRQCSGYEESKLTSKFIESLRAFSIPVTEDFDTEAFAELYFQIALLACPSITWSRIKGANIDVGGYGLFYN